MADGPLDLSQQEGFKNEEIQKEFGQSADDPQDIRVIISKLIRIILGFLGIIFTVLLIHAGFKWMTAAGNDEQAKEAKKQIINSVIGLLIVLAAYSITVFVMESLLGATSEQDYSQRYRF